MLKEYKRYLKITDYNDTTGILTYSEFYECTKSNPAEAESEIINKLNIVKRVPVKNDKIFFLNGCTIPRFKIKGYCNSNDCKVVKYIDSASVIILGKNTFNDHFIYENEHFVNKETLIEYLSNMMIELNTIEYSTWASTFVSYLQSYEGEIKSSSYYRVRNELDLGSSYDNLFVTPESYEKLLKIEESTCEFILEETLLKELNGGLIMDAEIYESIKRLIESSDDSNMKLAMEMMANCDYDKSAVYLMLLLKEYGAKMYGTNNSHHINFKALLKYFNITGVYYNLKIDNILESLKEKKLLSNKQKDILIPLVLENFDHKSEHYRASDIVFIGNDGNDIVDDEILDEIGIMDIPEPDGELLEAATKIVINQIEKILAEELINVSENGIDSLSEEKVCDEIPEPDSLVFDELTELIGYCTREGLSKFRDIIIEVRDLVRSSEDLLEIILYFKNNGNFDIEAALTYSYLNLE